MHKRNSIVNVPLLSGIVLSIAIHAAALYGKGIHTPPTPSLEQGRTVVRLTLIPSVAAQAAAAEPQMEIPAEPSENIPVEPQVEQAFLPAFPAEPVPLPEKSQASSLKSQASTPSPEQDASLVEEKGVTAEAQSFKTANPAYPRISRRRGEEGTVSVSIEVFANGKAGHVSVIRSSGYHRLDEAALKAAKETTFTPATQFGRKIDSTTELSFTFRLTND